MVVFAKDDELKVTYEWLEQVIEGEKETLFGQKTIRELHLIGVALKTVPFRNFCKKTVKCPKNRKKGSSLKKPSSSNKP